MKESAGRREIVAGSPPALRHAAPVTVAPSSMPEHRETNITYEQPLSERVRSFLRLEFLFNRASHLIGDPDPWACRTLIEVIIDVMAVLSRADLKKELIKELERQAGTMDALARNPNVDQDLLADVLAEVKGLLVTMRGLESVPGHELRNDELLSAVRQRTSIPAGTCDFDLPAYHFWLQSPAEQRIQILNQWLGAFDLLREAVTLCLRLVRESAVASGETAPGGFYQETLETSTPCQMIRVTVPSDSPYYPEISAGRHRFTIRFMVPAAPGRPTQTDAEVAFRLHRCVI